MPRLMVSLRETFQSNCAHGAVRLEGLPQADHQSRSEEHTSELQSHLNLVCRLLLEKKKTSRYSSQERSADGPSSLQGNTTMEHRKGDGDRQIPVHERRTAYRSASLAVPTYAMLRQS